MTTLGPSAFFTTLLKGATPVVLLPLTLFLLIRPYELFYIFIHPFFLHYHCHCLFEPNVITIFNLSDNRLVLLGQSVRLSTDFQLTKPVAFSVSAFIRLTNRFSALKKQVRKHHKNYNFPLFAL